MFWAIASSIFVVYLYRRLNAERAPTTKSIPDGSIETELTALNARIAALESRIGKLSAADAKP